MKRKSEGPQFVAYFGPVLEALKALGGSGKPEEVVDWVAEHTHASEQLLSETLPSGHPRFRNRVHWARFYLAKDELVDASRRGVWSLKERGWQTTLDAAGARDLFQKWSKVFQEQKRATGDTVDGVEDAVDPDTQTIPDLDYRGQIISVLIRLSPSGFERFCQRLLREAGFTSVEVSGRTSDGGIDGNGTLAINRLVTLRVLFQCKRYSGSVGAPQVRDFRGAMAGRADKGILITTGTFTADAKREASRDGASPIELIDGEKLISLMEELELGLKPKTIFEVDEHFFDAFKT